MEKNLKRSDVEITQNLQQKTEELVGKKVCVYVGGQERNNFEPQISVSGTLQQHPHDKEAFRVLMPADEGAYTYFNTANIKRIIGHESYTFKNGDVAIIHIQI